MTVSSTTDRQEFPGDGSNKNFPFNFSFFENSQIYVFLIDADGNALQLTETSDYVLTGAKSPSGGKVVTTVAPGSTYTLLVQRILPEVQATSFRNQGAFFPAIHEDAFDRVIMLIQQAISRASEALLFNKYRRFWDFKGFRAVNAADPINTQDLTTKHYVDVGNGLQDTRIDALSAGLPGTNYAFPWSTTTTTGTKTLTPGFEFAAAVLYLNGIAQTYGKAYVVSNSQILLAQAIPAGTEVYAILGQAVVPTPPAVNAFDLYDYAALRAYTGNASVVHITKPGIEGFFAFTDMSVADDQGIFITDVLGRRRARLFEGDVYPEWYGAVGDGVTNDSPAIQRAINYLRGTGGGTVSFTGRYLIDTNLFVEDWVALKGALGNPGELRYDGTSNYDAKQSLLIVNSAATITIRSGSSVGNCLVMRKGLDLPFADATAAAAGVAAFAGTAFTAGGSDVYIHEMLVLGFDKILYSNNFERIRVHHVQGDCTNGIELNAVFDIAYVDKVHLWPFTTTHQSWTTGALNSRSGTGFLFSNVGDWSKLTECFTYGYAKGFSIDGCNFVNLVGCGTDHFGANPANTSIGFEIKGLSKDATMIGCQMAAQGYGLVVDNNVGGLQGTAAVTTVVGCSFWDNDIKHADVRSGRVNFSSDNFWRSPVAIDVNSSYGKATIDMCDFEDITANAISTGSFDNLNIGPSNRFTNCVNNFGQRYVIEANPAERQQYSGNTTGGVAIQPLRSRGTTAAKTAVQVNDLVWQTDPYAHDGTNFIQSGGIRQAIGAVTGAGNIATKWIFSARATGAGAAADRWVMDGDGSFTPVGDNTQSLGKQANRWIDAYAARLRPGAGNVIWTSGTGTPEGAVTAVVGSMFTRTDGGSATTLYVKETGTGNTGWVAK